ncbi:hypothetical protein AHMF7605_25635 [Adhaeribacter arboris]|uniref:Uncharacterized protein n=1 Tax=Adhaeribacter arboris TaxID=2072846 RepID=A0A2T2YMA0_9BACT|nr:hypothetical protein [Adhaeribacter arboris]PSR56634.1 hypothetical protein AHMF7605_25635 [Adhaeribacter arboris]
MSQGFKLRYDQLRENDPTKADAVSTTSNKDYYESTGNARNLCLVWPNGRRVFISYSYLVSGEFKLDDDKNVITLSFSSHTITLKGFGLQPLFMALLDHLPRMIMAVDARYALNDSLKEALVLDMLVEKKAD